MHSAIDGGTLLALWERVVALPTAMRSHALLGEEGHAHTLGERNAKLAALHAQLFGREFDLLSHCPACATVAQFSGDCEVIAGTLPSGIAPTHRMSVGAHRIEFRLPRADDIAAASRLDGEERFARALLERCVIGCTRDDGKAVPAQALPAEVLDALSQRMEALDPAASVSFALDCPHCATHWDARLDLGQLVWQKLQAAAERLLLDVDALARTYGWTEPDVLALSATRRAAYLQMATS